MAASRPARSEASPVPFGGSQRPRPRTLLKQDRLLAASAALMARNGFDQTTLRDVARETGFSLAGLYYYFTDKEDLLFQIQHRTFSSLLEAQQARAEGGGSPEERLARLVAGHIDFFLRHENELKVCTFEHESLSGAPYRRTAELRRRYFKLVASVVAAIRGAQGRTGRLEVRQATMFLFGALNWIFMWYDPGKDGPAEELGRRMVEVFLRGARGPRPSGRSPS